MDALGITGPLDSIAPAPARRADALEWAASALRVRILGVLRRAPGVRRVARDAGVGESAALQAARERALLRVHDAAREAHAQWREGEDAADAMRRLGLALGAAAEFDA